jgi:hypothetical protein
MNNFAVFDDEHCRNGLHMEGLSGSGVLIDIELHKLHLALCSGCGTLEDGREALARTTPRSPEIDNHRNRMRTLYNLGLKGGIGDV